MKTWKLTIEYDGTKYSGWQKQINARTIQGELEKAACDLLGLKEVDLHGAGRTDAGVHAYAQVAHLKIKPDIRIATDRLIWGMNDRLPSDINVLDAQEAKPSFHARHDAKSRAYVYQISRRRTAFGKRYVWWIREELSVDRMALAAQTLAGRHDFAGFAQKDPSKPGESTIVVVDNVAVEEEEDMILIRIEASHFLWKMVRRIVGTLVKLGKGEITEAQFAQILTGKAALRSGLDVASWTAPASGLFLERITY